MKSFSSRLSLSLIATLVSISLEVSTAFSVAQSRHGKYNVFSRGCATKVFQSPSSFGDDDGSGSREDGTQTQQRLSEFVNLEPIEEPEFRKQRKELDEANKEKFVDFGDELWTLRKIQNKLKEEISISVQEQNKKQVNAFLQNLRDAQSRDPEYVYGREMQLARDAAMSGDDEKSKEHQENAMGARSRLPHYNLEGLWVGKYGEHGYEMINVTYSGDMLIAYKVTGDKNVPRGEITFQVDLSPKSLRPRRVGDSNSNIVSSLRNENDDGNTLSPPSQGFDDEIYDLKPVKLSDNAAKKWGTKQLPRYKGIGQVADVGFVNHQWLDGQLIMISEEYFSFAWLPIEHQIFFGRPSPELALKMLKDHGGIASGHSVLNWNELAERPSIDDDVELLKDYAMHILEVSTETIEDEMNLCSSSPPSCIWHDEDSEECYFQ